MAVKEMKLHEAFRLHDKDQNGVLDAAEFGKTSWEQSAAVRACDFWVYSDTIPGLCQQYMIALTLLTDCF